MTPTRPRPVSVVRPASALVDLYDAMAAERRNPNRWTDLPLMTRGSLRTMWATARAGQLDPLLVALAGVRYRRAFLSAGPTDWVIFRQYLDVAARIVEVTAASATTPSRHVA